MKKAEAVSRIIESCKNINPDSKGYVADNDQIDNNLVYKFENWNEIKAELGAGQGSELKIRSNGLRKFNAVHSSAALCVNNFAPIKLQPNRFFFQNWAVFTEEKFEKKISTGISTPNLDFSLETKKVIIGFESKYTEILDKKNPNHGRNLEKYLNRKQLNYLPAKFEYLIEEYINCKAKLYLDVAQLIKHAIGLIRNAGVDKTPVLVYIYWLPLNWKQFVNFRVHNKELKYFTSKILNYMKFKFTSYIDFWDLNNNSYFGAHFRKVKERYSIELDNRNT